MAELSPEAHAAQSLRVIAGEVRRIEDMSKYHWAACIVRDRMDRARTELKAAKALEAEWKTFVGDSGEFVTKLIETDGEVTASGNSISRTPGGSTYVKRSKESKVKIVDVAAAVMEMVTTDDAFDELIGHVTDTVETVVLNEEGKALISEFALDLMLRTGEIMPGVEITPEGSKSLVTKTAKRERTSALRAAALLPRAPSLAYSDTAREEDQSDE